MHANTVHACMVDILRKCRNTQHEATFTFISYSSTNESTVRRSLIVIEGELLYNKVFLKDLFGKVFKPVNEAVALIFLV